MERLKGFIEMKYGKIFILNVIFSVASCSESAIHIGCATEVTFQFFYNGSTLKEYTGVLNVEGRDTSFYSVEISCPSQPLAGDDWGRCVDGKLFFSDDSVKKIHIEIKTKDVSFKPVDVITNYKKVSDCQILSEHNINLELE